MAESVLTGYTHPALQRGRSVAAREPCERVVQRESCGGLCSKICAASSDVSLCVFECCAAAIYRSYCTQFCTAYSVAFCVASFAGCCAVMSVAQLVFRAAVLSSVRTAVCSQLWGQPCAARSHASRALCRLVTQPETQKLNYPQCFFFTTCRKSDQRWTPVCSCAASWIKGRL